MKLSLSPIHPQFWKLIFQMRPLNSNKRCSTNQFRSRKLSDRAAAKRRVRNVSGTGLTAKGWVQETFTIKKTINDEPRESISHKVDHVRIFDRSNGKRTDLLSKSNGIIRTLSSTGIWRILSGSTQKGEFRSG